MGKTNLPSDKGDRDRLAELVVLYMEGVLTEPQRLSLRSGLQENREHRALFVELMLQRCGIVRLLSRESLAADPFADASGADAAKSDESEESSLPPKPIRFPAVPSPRPEVPAKPSRRIHGWLIAAAVLGIAVLCGVLRQFSGSGPIAPGPVSAATIGRSSEAEWEFASPGAAGLLTGKSFGLTSGIIELACSGGARLVLEGPARFTLDSPTAISLTSGKLSATVHGGGFVVKTPTATVTDLGTEFGVAVNSDGSTTVDVFQGRVQAVSDASSGTGSAAATVLSEGQAARISAVAGVQADPGGASPQRFIRSITTDATPLDVTDLVAGGDGTTHRRGVGIDVTMGRTGQLTQVATQQGDHVYHRVAGLPVVDGCFIPDGSQGPMQIDSLGHAFTFPATSNQTFNLLWAGGAIPPADEHTQNGRAVSAVLDGVDYSMSGHGCLAMHANKGLTLDLDQIRRLHPRSSLSRFTCIVGNSWKFASKDTDRPPLPAKFYIIVDGLQRYTQTAGASGSRVEVPLAASERFLTLAVVDGGSAIRANWILVGDPVVELLTGDTQRNEIRQ